MVGTTTAINPSFLGKGVYSTISVPGEGGPLKDTMKVEVVRLEDGAR
jgi:hypothetical protein